MTYEKECVGKRAYDTAPHADEHAEALQDGTGRVYHSYLCPHCLSFHVGSTTYRKMRRTGKTRRKT